MSTGGMIVLGIIALFALLIVANWDTQRRKMSYKSKRNEQGAEIADKFIQHRTSVNEANIPVNVNKQLGNNAMKLNLSEGTKNLLNGVGNGVNSLTAGISGGVGDISKGTGSALHQIAGGTSQAISSIGDGVNQISGGTSKAVEMIGKGVGENVVDVTKAIGVAVNPASVVGIGKVGITKNNNEVIEVYNTENSPNLLTDESRDGDYRMRAF